MPEFSSHLASARASTSRASVRVWDLPVRLFHWLLAGTILVAFLSSEEDSLLAAWHIPVGWIAAVLIAFRISWGFVGGEHARFAAFLKPGRLAHHLRSLLIGKPERTIGHNVLGGIAIIALLSTIGGIVYTGSTMRGEIEGSLHETLSNGLLGLIALHVVAVITMSMLTRDNLIGAFVTGKKRADLHPGVSDARAPARLAIPIAAIAIGAAAYGATVLDPTAFKPGTNVELGESDDGEMADHDRDDD